MDDRSEAVADTVSDATMDEVQLGQAMKRLKLLYIKVHPSREIRFLLIGIGSWLY